VGFTATHHDQLGREAAFQWGTADQPDFVFHLFFQDRRAASAIAESYSDIFGLVLTSHSDRLSISVETKPASAQSEYGRNAIPIRKILLTFPDFDGGVGDSLASFGIT
jgi:hypothetical protein